MGSIARELRLRVVALTVNWYLRVAEPTLSFITHIVYTAILSADDAFICFLIGQYNLEYSTCVIVFDFISVEESLLAFIYEVMYVSTNCRLFGF